MKSILVFVLFATILCWLMFSPIYKHVLIVRQAVLQQEVDYLLEIGASGKHGYISPEMVEQSRQRLAKFGMKPEALNFEVASDNGEQATNSTMPLLRGTGLIVLLSYPYEGLFQLDRLIGVKPPDENGRLRATGIKMSEYVP